MTDEVPNDFSESPDAKRSGNTDTSVLIERAEYLRSLMKSLGPKPASKEAWDRLIERRDTAYEVKRMIALAERGFFDG